MTHIPTPVHARGVSGSVLGVRALAPVLALVSIGAVTACTARDTSAPTAASPSSARAAALPYGGAPKVEDPLPPSVLSGDPCRDAVTPEQLREILGTPTSPQPDNIDATGPTCHWGNLDSGAGLDVYYDIRTRQGLSSVYQNAKPKTTTWRPLPLIRGLPAVAFSINTGSRVDDSCDVSVGIADDYSVDAALNLGHAKAGKTDPCEPTARVAAMVIDNLRRKTGR